MTTPAGFEREGVLPSASRRALLVGGGVAAAAATAVAVSSRPAEAAVKPAGQVGETQPLNAFRMARSAKASGGEIERVYPNTQPTVQLES